MISYPNKFDDVCKKNIAFVKGRYSIQILGPREKERVRAIHL
jgi:hypothetical protein